jgi:2-methylcitrate dehydratase PrpD
MSMTLAEIFGHWIARLEPDEIPAGVVREAKRCIIDCIGVTLAGAQHETAQAVRELVRAEFGNDTCTLIGTNVTSSATGAALANGTAAHVLDFDDTSYEGALHASAVVWPAALAAAEATGASGNELMAAFVAGVETEYALGRMLMDRPFSRGWWTTGVLGGIGAAAGAARAMRLGAPATVRAVAMAAAYATGMRANAGTAANSYGVGHAARIGVEAALYARSSLSAPVDVFENQRGFFKLFADAVPDVSTLELGERYALQSPGVALKLFPAASATQAAVEAFAGILSTEGITAQQVARVRCEITPLAYRSLPYHNPRTVAHSQFSLPFAIGCILTFGEFGIKQVSDAALNDAGLRANLGKVEVLQSDELVANEPRKHHNPEGAIVTVTTTAGRSVRRINGAATGMPSRPMPDHELDNKFRSCAALAMTQPAADALLERIAMLDLLPTARDLFQHQD